MPRLLALPTWQLMEREDLLGNDNPGTTLATEAGGDTDPETAPSTTPTSRTLLDFCAVPSVLAHPSRSLPRFSEVTSDDMRALAAQTGDGNLTA